MHRTYVDSSTSTRELRPVPEQSAAITSIAPICLCVVCGHQNPLRVPSLVEVLDASSGLGDAAAAGAPFATPMCVFCTCRCSGDGHGARTARGHTACPQLVIRSDRVHLRDLGIDIASENDRDQHAQSNEPLVRAASFSSKRKYVAVREVGTGEGQFASTFVCAYLDESDQPRRVRQLALKRINRLYPRASEVVRETGTLAWLSRHRNYGTPTLWDVVTWHGRFCLIMDYYDASSIGSHLKGGRRFSVDEVASFLEQMALILCSVHKNKILHRDIHPGNVLVLDRKSLRPPRFVLIDFGIAAAAELDRDEDLDPDTLDLQRAQSFIVGASEPARGNTAYMPIEQVRGRAVRASDLFAVGKVACEMLLGTNSRALANDARLAKSLIDPDPSDVELATICLPLRRVLSKLLQADYEERYQSASELWRALRNEGILPEEFLGPEAPQSLQVLDFVRGDEEWDVIAQIRDLREAMQNNMGPPSPASELSSPMARAVALTRVKASFRVNSHMSVFDPHGFCAGASQRFKRANRTLTDEQAMLSPKRMRGGSVWLDVDISTAARDVLERALAPASDAGASAGAGAGAGAGTGVAAGEGEPPFSLSRSLAAMGVLEVVTRPSARPFKLPAAEGVRCPYVWGAGPFRLTPPAELQLLPAPAPMVYAQLQSTATAGAPTEQLQLAGTAAAHAPPFAVGHLDAKNLEKASRSSQCIGIDLDSLVLRIANFLRWGDGGGFAQQPAPACSVAASSTSGVGSSSAASVRERMGRGQPDLVSSTSSVSTRTGLDMYPEGPLSPPNSRSKPETRSKADANLELNARQAPLCCTL